MRNPFISGLWAGFTAPMTLFENPPSYPRFEGRNSLRRSFAKVSGYLNYAVSRHRERSGNSTAAPK
jgi:hypothetical protein